MSSAIAIVLIACGVLSRFLPHPHGAVAIGALAIYAAARLPRRWAIAVPVAALLISDATKVWNTQYLSTLWSVEAVVRYTTFALIVLVGARYKTNRPAGLVALSLGASTLFFLTSNFMIWLFPRGLPGEPGTYARDLAGLAQCYAAAIPFFRNSLMADLIGTGVLFGLDAVASLVAQRSQRRLVVETVRVD